MTPCGSCAHQNDCRVPNDLARFDRVAHRLETEHRQPALQRRIDHYVHYDHCLIEAGIATP